ncbi:ABC transporter ATP-binding protein [Polynucleobacter sp. AP-Sanab-80-C2]|uniref:ABC transporter ATP-binding protein n=1 Tax=Polynucleobacter sp. AP-Sanab-80-C2 TaxID=3108274 RepID=UPI002B228804|nr:ABC transporter ATP-binding protein [Polynucleobacter sp. AP-Sanab-80-C2]MEA9598536.1 ABC transporter ATP-binding protein [Polynucleobacter sp. AP-Sanab-80-C2]
MSSEEIVLSVKNLSKHYEIYEKPGDRLKQFIFPKFSRLFGKAPKKYYREFLALDNISFDLKRGETVGIIGRNGSGKSTLLQMICGILKPSSGSIEVRGRIAALLELGSGFNPEFTGRDNVYMNGSILGLSKEEIDQRYDEICAFADIGEFIDQPINCYSSGMIVRLAFAVIAHVDADILIVDEALSVGDAFFNQKCMRFIREFQSNGGTLLFVSHDTGAVLNLCNGAILLSHGQIIARGSPKEATKHYLEALYEESQNIDGTISGNSVLLDDDAEGVTDYRDMREDLFNASTLRNDVEIFKFHPEESGFGAGNAEITSVQLLNKDGMRLSWAVGGEDIILDIRSLAHKEILCPIVGFEFKDRLGQVIFSDNTYLVYRDQPQPVSKGCELIAKFNFRLPVLPSGDYSISVALADGLQDSHIQLHWLHDALILKVHSSSVCYGLVGVAMNKIELLAL